MTYLERTLGSEAKYSMRVEGTSAKSVEHLVPVTCWYLVLEYHSLMSRIRGNVDEISPLLYESHDSTECYPSSLASMECMACPISWKRLSMVPPPSSVGDIQLGGFRFSIRTTTGFW